MYTAYPGLHTSIFVLLLEEQFSVEYIVKSRNLNFFFSKKKNLLHECYYRIQDMGECRVVIQEKNISFNETLPGTFVDSEQ
jgi:hypothetical protein